MNILLLNWRDIKNPLSGGAEILTHEIAKGLVRNGHKVIQFSSLYPGGKRTEIIDGVKILRDGNPDMRLLFSSVHFKAFRKYKKKEFGKLDVVIDEIHGVPFFTPLYVRERKVALICEYAGSLWDKAVRPPFNYLGRIVEKLYPTFYQSIKIITISNSSKNDIRENLFPKHRIDVIYPGCTTPIIKKVRLKKNLELVFIARLAKTKGVEDAIHTIQILKKTNPQIKLHIIGRGDKEYVKSLKKRISQKNLNTNISMYGYLSEKDKIKLIDRCTFIIIPSQKEGWGLTVHEANSRGVPAIGYKIRGLEDVIVDGVNGFLTKNNTPESLANQILTIISDKKLYNNMTRTSVLQRKKFSWDNTVQSFMEIIR